MRGRRQVRPIERKKTFLLVKCVDFPMEIGASKLRDRAVPSAVPTLKSSCSHVGCFGSATSNFYSPPTVHVCAADGITKKVGTQKHLIKNKGKVRTQTTCCRMFLEKSKTCCGVLQGNSCYFTCTTWVTSTRHMLRKVLVKSFHLVLCKFVSRVSFSDHGVRCFASLASSTPRTTTAGAQTQAQTLTLTTTRLNFVLAAATTKGVTVATMSANIAFPCAPWTPFRFVPCPFLVQVILTTRLSRPATGTDGVQWGARVFLGG